MRAVLEPDRVLRRLRRATAALGLLTVVLAGVALWLAVDNPTVGDTGGDEHSCLAPWDTVLNDANNEPGGEPPSEADQIARRCERAGEERFDRAVSVGVATGAAAVAVLGAGVATSLRDRGVL